MDKPKGDLEDDRHRFRRFNRLPNSSSFGRVFRKPERSSDRFFTVLYRPNGGRIARLGLAVAKKSCRLASGRNRIKRVVRESFRRHKAALPGLDVIVKAMPAAATADNAALYRSLEKHWRRCRSEPTSSKQEKR